MANNYCQFSEVVQHLSAEVCERGAIMTKYTYLPWVHGPGYPGGKFILGDRTGTSSIIVAHVGREIDERDAAWPIVEANADLIVRAANVHDHLVETLRDILEEAEEREDIDDDGRGGRPNAWMVVATRCREALARVERKED